VALSARVDIALAQTIMLLSCACESRDCVRELLSWKLTHTRHAFVCEVTRHAPHRSRSSLWPGWCDPRPATRRDPRPVATRDPSRPATRDPRPATRDPRPATRDPRPATRDPRPTSNPRATRARPAAANSAQGQFNARSWMPATRTEIVRWGGCALSCASIATPAALRQPRPPRSLSAAHALHVYWRLLSL